MSKRPHLIVVLALGLAAGGCPPKPPPEEPAPLPEYEPPEPTEPEPEAPPPEAGVVKLSSALMLGGKDLSREDSEAASAAFQASFDEGLSLFRRCYAEGLQRNPELSGQLDVDVVIQADGTVYELKVVADELGDPGVVRCVLKAFRELKYQPLREGQYFSVTAPVKFRPE